MAGNTEAGRSDNNYSRWHFPFDPVVAVGLRLRHPDVLGAGGAHVPAGVVLQLPDQVLQVPDADGPARGGLILLVFTPGIVPVYSSVLVVFVSTHQPWIRVSSQNEKGLVNACRACHSTTLNEHVKYDFIT